MFLFRLAALGWLTVFPEVRLLLRQLVAVVDLMDVLFSAASYVSAVMWLDVFCDVRISLSSQHILQLFQQSKYKKLYMLSL